MCLSVIGHTSEYAKKGLIISHRLICYWANMLEEKEFGFWSQATCV